MRDVIIIGGGLAGLISAISLRKSNCQVTLIEKKSYPFHRVCGEYISNEVKPYLEREGLYPTHLSPTEIKRFWLTSVNGRKAEIPLKMGAFGVSRYELDFFLYQKASELGVEFILNDTVSGVSYIDDKFEISTLSGKQLLVKYVIGSFGKRSILDKKMNRNFIQKKSPFLGVKYHVKTDFPEDVIALHNFTDGYCGISKVEDGKYNLCYLSHQKNIKAHAGIAQMEEAILWQNPHLKRIFQESEFLWDKPEVINEISFERKLPVENHVLMVGDAAGLITPLCGNGMAMAIHGAKVLTDILIEAKLKNRTEIERLYQSTWVKMFQNRLMIGKKVQNLFGSPWLSNVAVSLAKYNKPITSMLIEKTHGHIF